MRRIAFAALLAGILLDINGCTGYAPSPSAPPKIMATVSPSPNAAGWNNTNVSVSFVCSGTTSAIAYCSPPVLVQTEGRNQVIIGTARDAAGKTASASVTLNIDKTPPTITATANPSPNTAGWNNTDVSVSFACSDTMSAVASCPQAVPVQTEGRNQVISGTATDLAGNTASASVTLNIDKTPPVATITTPLQGQFFGASPVTVQGTIGDLLSGVATVTCNGATATLSNLSFSCDVSLVSGQNTVTIAATDLAGNTDSSSLTVTFEAPALDLAYVEDLQAVWWTAPSGPTWNSFAAFYKPVVPQGYYSLGDYGEAITAASVNAPTPAGFALVAKDLEPGALAQPVGYTSVWGLREYVSFWQPVPPPGYVCLGLVAEAGYNPPDVDEIRCVRQDLTVAGQVAFATEPGQVDSEVWYTLFWQCPSGCPPAVNFAAWLVVAQDPYAISTGAFVGAASGNLVFQPSGPFYCLDARRVKGAVDGLWKLGSQDVTQLVEKYGPLLQLDPDEIFLPDDTGYSLNFAKLEWGLVQNENDYDTFNFQTLGSIPTSADGLMNDVNSHVTTDPHFADPAFRQWLRMPTEWGAPYTTPAAPGTPGGSGNLSRARADIRVVPWNWLFTELQFWLYYPFNGPGRVKICFNSYLCSDDQMVANGRHYSDWEHVTLRILNSTKELVGVFGSHHGAGYWFLQRDFANPDSGNPLSFSDTHPWLYVAKYSHAHYPTLGVHYYLRVYQVKWLFGTRSADLFDETGTGQFYRVYQPSSYEVVSSALPGYPVSEPDWVQFQGLWGQYEWLGDHLYWNGVEVYTYKTIGTGPGAPIVNDCWTKGESGPGSWGFWRHP
jgi:Vacuolar protein sorting-associated protein 62/Glucodextranase, domain B